MECTVCGKHMGWTDYNGMIEGQRLCESCYKYFNEKNDSVDLLERYHYFKGIYHDIEGNVKLKGFIDKWMEKEEPKVQRITAHQEKMAEVNDVFRLLSWEWFPEDFSEDFATFTAHIKEDIFDFVKVGWKIISYNMTSCTYGATHGYTLSGGGGSTQGTVKSGVFCQCLITKMDEIMAV